MKTLESDKMLNFIDKGLDKQPYFKEEVGVDIDTLYIFVSQHDKNTN